MVIYEYGARGVMGRDLLPSHKIPRSLLDLYPVSSRTKNKHMAAGNKSQFLYWMIFLLLAQEALRVRERILS